MPFKRAGKDSSMAVATAVAEPVAEPTVAAAQTATPVATATAAVTVAAPARLADQIDRYASEVSAALQESMLITPDSEFLPPHWLRA